MKVMYDTVRQEKGLALSYFFTTTLLMGVLIYLYPGDEAAVEQLTGLTEMGDWEAAFGIKYGEGAEYRLWLAYFVFSYIGIIYVAIPSLIGTGVITKDRDWQTLDIFMGNPISRRRVLTEKTSAVLFLSFISVAYLFLVVIGLSWSIGQSIKMSILFAACLQIFIFLIFVSTLSIYFAILFRDLGRARRYIGLIILGSFIISMLVLTSEELEFLKYIEIFYYLESAATIMKPNWSAVDWTKSIYLLILSGIFIILSYHFNNTSDLYSHFSHRVEDKRKKSKGIPVIFFYMRWWQKKYPILVEQLQADKYLIYTFAGLVAVSGVITPGMYPGDESWVGLSKTYENAVLIGAILHGHGVSHGFISYIATEGIGEFFIYMGIIAMIIGPKVVIRDQKTNTADLLISQPVYLDKILKQRLAAVIVEFITIFLISYLAYIVGIITSGYGVEYIVIIGIVLFYTCIICLTMTFLLVFVTTLLNDSRRAIGIAGILYYSTLVIFMVAYSIDRIKFLAYITPFYWADRVGMLYRNGIIWEDGLVLSGYMGIMLISAIGSIKQFVKREFN